MAREIYRIKFGHYMLENGIPAYRMYTIGRSGDVDGEFITPKKITIKDNKIRVVFEELGIIHEFFMTDKTEVYYRNKIKQDAQETTDRTE